MPDDVKEQVAEQDETKETAEKETVETEEVVETEEEEEEFSDAFAEASVEKTAETTKETEEEKTEETEEEEAEETTEKEDKDKDKEEVDEEADAAEKRGESIIKDKEKEAADAEAARKKEEAEAARAEESKIIPFSEEDIHIFAGLVQEGELPNEVTINGEKVSLKDYNKDNPEIPIIAGVVAQNMLQRLVSQGILVTGKQHEGKIEKLKQDLMSHIFDLNVLRQVPDAYEIVDSKGYQEWKDKVASKNVVALLESTNPNDMTIALKRYKKYEVEKKAEAAKAEKDKKIADEKKKHDEIHSSTLRSKALGRKTSKASSKDDEDSEYSDAFAEAAEEAD